MRQDVGVSEIALVTGADRGLGRAITEQLLDRGWTVLAGQVLVWPELAELQARFGDRLHVLPLDVGSDDSVLAAAATATGLVGHIDMVVNNAGINRSAHIDSVRDELDFDDMQAEHNINAVGPLRVVRAFLPLMAASEHKLLCFVSSEAGSIGASRRTGWFGYCMSKAAVNMAVKNLSNDLSREGFRFRLFQPGWMKTYMRGTRNDEAALEPEESARRALSYFLDEPEPSTLTLRTWDGEDMPW